MLIVQIDRKTNAISSARGIIDKYGTMPLALKALFPEHYWEEWRFQSTSAQDDTET
jgi:hypothetical protein